MVQTVTLLFLLTMVSWINGLPLGIEGQLEVSPSNPVLGEPFYVRVVLSNKGDESVTIPDSYPTSMFFSRASYVLDVLSDNLGNYSRGDYKFDDSGLIIAPEFLSNTKCSPLLQNTKRVILLDEYKLFQLDFEDKEKWNNFVNEKDAKLRFTYFTEDKKNAGCLTIPIQFRPLPNVFLDMAKEEKQICEEKTQGKSKEEAFQLIDTTAVRINAQNRAACLLLPKDQRRSFEKRYPPGTSRMKLHLLILKQEMIDSGFQKTKVEEFIHYFWTLPEIERQVLAMRTLMLILVSYNDYDKQLRTIPKVVESLIQMSPEHYDATFPQSRKILYEKWLQQKLSGTISTFEEIINRPLPVYAGQGNEARGFFLPFVDWSINDEKMRLITFFENNLTFETENAKEFIVPFEKLSEKEKKYVQELLKNH
jgi:hypothetical protein